MMEHDVVTFEVLMRLFKQNELMYFAMWVIVVFCVVRVATLIWNSIFFREVKDAGIGDFAKLLKSKKSDDSYLIKGKFLNRFRGLLFEVFLRLVRLVFGASALSVLLGFVPFPEFSWFLSHRWELGVAAVVAGIVSFEKPFVTTQARNLIGTSFFVFFKTDKIAILRFVLWIPWYRSYPYEEGLTITPMVEKFSEKVSRVVIRIGHNSVVLGNVYGHRDADLISNAFITLNHLKAKASGLDRMGVENANTRRLGNTAQTFRAE